VSPAAKVKRRIRPAVNGLRPAGEGIARPDRRGSSIHEGEAVRGGGEWQEHCCRGSPMSAAETAAPLVPPHPTLASLRAAAARCRACDLWKRGTQTVFGEGARSSRILFVGEQPGDQEDLAGRPFVGPSGRLLDEAMEEAGIDRKSAYVTNAVKHFKWEPRGKRRIHEKPSAMEISACKPWLAAEIAVVRQAIVVALGATAARALLGPAFRVTRDRGRVVETTEFGRVIATVHPSSILRAPDETTRREERRRFVADLRKIARAAARAPAAR
jgi:DNA polymerase